MKNKHLKKEQMIYLCMFVCEWISCVCVECLVSEHKDLCTPAFVGTGAEVLCNCVGCHGNQTPRQSNTSISLPLNDVERCASVSRSAEATSRMEPCSSRSRDSSVWPSTSDWSHHTLISWIPSLHAQEGNIESHTELPFPWRWYSILRGMRFWCKRSKVRAAAEHSTLSDSFCVSLVLVSDELEN